MLAICPWHSFHSLLQARTSELSMKIQLISSCTALQVDEKTPVRHGSQPTLSLPDAEPMQTDVTDWGGLFSTAACRQVHCHLLCSALCIKPCSCMGRHHVLCKAGSCL